MSGQPKQDCPHKVGHRHGTRACYTICNCRCDDCRTVQAAYDRRYRRRRGYGLPSPYVAAEPARAHIRHLMATGYSVKVIEREAACSHAQITRLLYGLPSEGLAPSKRLEREAAGRILALRFDLNVVPPAAKVDGTGSRRRMQALVALGYSMSILGDRLGMAPRHLRRTVHAEQVTARTALKIGALYDELWNTAPAGTTPGERTSIGRTKTWAKTNGWLPPLAWDDDTIDVPGELIELEARKAIHTESRAA